MCNFVVQIKKDVSVGYIHDTRWTLFNVLFVSRIAIGGKEEPR